MSLESQELNPVPKIYWTAILHIGKMNIQSDKMDKETRIRTSLHL